MCIYSKAGNRDGVIDGPNSRMREKRLTRPGPVELLTGGNTADGVSVVMHAGLLQFFGVFWHGTKHLSYVRTIRGARTK